MEEADLQRTFHALRTLSSTVRTLTLHHTDYVLPLADVASFTALESLALTETLASGICILLPNAARALAGSCCWCHPTRRNLSEQSAHAVVVACPELRRLRFQHSCHHHWLQRTQTEVIDLSRLEVVELYVCGDVDVTNTTMATLASSCMHLREVHMHVVHNPRPHSTQPDSLGTCPPTPALVKLRLCGFFLNLTSFAAFLVNAPQLEKLSLKKCCLYGAMKALPANSSLRFLECRSLLFGQSIDFWRFDTWCPNLTSLLIEAHSESETFALSVGGCSRLVSLNFQTNQWWHYRRLPWACPLLGVLKILFCIDVHWQDLSALARASPHLQEVSLRDCHYEDKNAILELLSSCPRLCRIRIVGPQPSFEVMDRLACGSHITRGHLCERVHLERVDGEWGLNWGDGLTTY
eukprot:SM000095S24947  [mRNA]  locus=s95:13168:14704:+ [translate_table: standard]